MLEERKANLVFFLIGMSLCLPSNAIINMSFLINSIYDEEVCIGIMGYFSVAMLVPAIACLIFEFISFKSMLSSIILNCFNLFALLIIICMYKLSKLYIYIVVIIIGISVGYTYSVATTYSILFNKKVNGYLVLGTSFCSLFHYIINSLTSFFMLVDGDINSYNRTVAFSLGITILIKIMFIAHMFHVYINSPYFIERKQIIECNNLIKVNNDIEHDMASKLECEENLSSKYKTKCDDNDNNSYNVIVKTQKIDAPIDNIMNIPHLKLKNFFSKFKNIIDGFYLIKYFYLCLFPIFFNIFLTFIIYPHYIPNKLIGNVGYKYLYVFLFQIGDISLALLFALYTNFLNFIKQKYVAIICFLRIFLLVAAILITKSLGNPIFSSIYFTSFIILTLGFTNASIIKMSFGRIHECFDNVEQKEKKIQIACSFSSLIFLIGYALSPIVCTLLSKL